jgi:hypothetical protein
MSNQRSREATGQPSLLAGAAHGCGPESPDAAKAIKAIKLGFNISREAAPALVLGKSPQLNETFSNEF